MNKYFRLALSIGAMFCFASLDLSAQSNTKYIVRFKDKANSPYTISQPSQYLSAKAIARRNKQKIAIDETDLPVNKNYIAGVANQGVRVLNRSKWFNFITIETNDSTKLIAINKLPYVLQSEPVGRLKKLNTGDEHITLQKKNQVPADITSSHSTRITQTNTGLNYGDSYNQIHMTNADILHQMGYLGQGMTIAVIDAGFYKVNEFSAFDSLWANKQILGTWDFIENNNSVFEDDSHGMSVLSTMGGNLPGELIGTAPKAKFWLLRSEYAPSEYVIEEANWVSAAEYADSVGVDLINSSLGYTTFDNPSQNHTYADMNGTTTIISKAATMAAHKGILVENSAGNEGSSNWKYIGAPADAKDILTTGSVRAGGSYSPFSSQGPTSDGRVKPDVVAQGSAAVIENSAGMVGTGSGTSFSGPIMTGMVACFWQAKPELTNLQVIQEVIKSASQYKSPDTLLGYGIPDFAKAIQTNQIKSLIGGSKNQTVQLFPNPVVHNQAIHVKLNNSEKLIISLLDMTGRVVYFTTANGQESIEIPAVISGLYIIQVTSHNNGQIIQSEKVSVL